MRTKDGKNRAGGDFAGLCEKFFTTWLKVERNVSQATISAYAQTMRLLLRFVAARLRITPNELSIVQFDAEIIGEFLAYLETDRANSIRSRNARRAAICAFFRMCALECPKQSLQIQRILAIPTKRFHRRRMVYLNRFELASVLEAIDQSRWIGRRNYVMLLLASQTGLRNSELAGIRRRDVEFGLCPAVKCFGKGRKERITPLRRDVTTCLRRWLDEREGSEDDFVFATAEGRRLSADAIQYTVRKCAEAARERCPSLKEKKLVPHTFRHTAAMTMLEDGVDLGTIAAWLGHESMETTRTYAEHSLQAKEKALAKTTANAGKMPRFSPDDNLLKFLASL